MSLPITVFRTLVLAAGSFGLLCVLQGLSPAGLGAQGVTKETYERARKMLEQVRKDLREFYYDSTYQGLDIDARFEKADSAMRVAKDNNHLMAAIAEYVADLKDSHTTFRPPTRQAKIDYGVGVLFVGETLYVDRVRKGMDAEKKGLKRGDAVLQIDAFKPERKTWDILRYVYYVLNPRPVVRLTVRSPDGVKRQVDVHAKITMGQKTVDYDDPSTISRLIDEYERAERTPDHYYQSLGDSVLIWRMPSFAVGTEGVDDMIKKVKKHRSVILDLRDNGGGLVSTMLHLVAHFFDRDIQVFTLKTRKENEPMIAKAHSKDPFRGMLVILVNSNSASASEITSRMMQIEERGIVVGDRSMGAVVTSITRWHQVGFGRVLDYALQVSVSDVVMPDGKRLEHIGVIPDHMVLPSGADMAERRDPQMAKALSLVGVTMSPEEAGALFRSKEKKSADSR